MASFRLKEEHPLSQKLEKVFALMEELDIRIDVMGNQTIVTDNETGTKASIRDLEAYNNDITDFPPAFEYKLIIDKD